ncbi:GDNF-inducible zinc finger protein 1 isoform X14 [Bicyclus anynana]|uniref:GDNF-inducible zinc finger protein 1 isoform X14 n=1 Tax=Bicyclus anynana TaxID=110368 RepID=A0ABM3M230_BICAN|nr:GDNF-inducible zinc finger protein 1 isoform X14 [Bicyclus anynana]
MAAKTSEWRPGPTVCRCCLSEGCYKDISTEYFWMGKREVYSEMLSDTFDLSISYSKSGGPNSASRLICEPCIGRLRDAAEFKRQVQECEKTFVQCLDPVTALADMQVTLELEKEVKVEMVKEEKMRLSDDDDYGAHDYGDDDDDYDDLDDQPLTKLASKIPKKEDVDVLDLLDNAKVTEKRKSSTKVKGQPSKKSKCKQTAGSSKQQKPEPKKKKDPVIDEADGQNDNTIEQLKTQLLGDFDDSPVNVHCLQDVSKTPSKRFKVKKEIREDSIKLLKYSNICLFKSLKTKYKCYSCKASYVKITDLREHSTIHYSKIAEFNIKLPGNVYPYADTSSLMCRICLEKCKDLANLTNHLTNNHQIEFRTSEHMFVPYRLEDGFKCVLCNTNFNAFVPLSTHMNKHSTNHICEACGMSFYNNLSLRNHKYYKHKNALKKCTICNEKFSKNYAKLKHMRKFHNLGSDLRYCVMCNEAFKHSYMLEMHKVKEHGAKRPTSECEDCGKTFITSQNLKIHIRSVHIGERNYVCDKCGMKFFTKADQVRHKKRHEDVKSYVCSKCDTRFKSKDSWVRHQKNKHLIIC